MHQYLTCTVIDKSIRRLEPPLVFLRYLLNQCKYQRETFSTLVKFVFLHGWAANFLNTPRILQT